MKYDPSYNIIKVTLWNNGKYTDYEEYHHNYAL